MLQRKLCGRKGASMILALVFLLFCSFVGSTVLVSATANAYRVKHLTDQQSFLTERSTALLLTDELQLGDGKRLQMTVVDTLNFVEEVTVGPDGSAIPTGRSIYRRAITFKVVTNLDEITSSQRLLLEVTVRRYLSENPSHAMNTSVTPAVTEITLENFPAGKEVTATNVVASKNDFWTVEDETKWTLSVTGSVNAGGTFDGTLPSYTVRFTSGRGENLYDFYMDLGDFSQLKVAVNAFYGITRTEGIVTPAAPDPNFELDLTGNTGSTTTQVTSSIYETIISWDDPMVEKGGA